MTTTARLQHPAARSTHRLHQVSPSLESAGNGHGLIRFGMQGEGVRELQRALVARGENIAVDGDFGSETASAVRRFQRASGIGIDAVVGPETVRALTTRPRAEDAGAVRTGDARAPTVTERNTTTTQPGIVRAADLTRLADFQRSDRGRVAMAPAGASEREKFDHYARIVRANGGQVNPNGQPTVLGLRGIDAQGRVHDTTSARAYRDRFVVLTADGRVTELTGATHAGQNSSSQSPDVTRDGAGDVGMMRPGNFTVRPNGNRAGYASYYVTRASGSGSLPGHRDTNHDGTFSDAERAASERRGDTVSEILFHVGNAARPSSIGCQTLSPQEMTRFVSAVGGSRASFSYTLVDAYRA